MLGVGEILFIVSILVLFFGARKLPQLGSSLGSTLRMFKDGMKGKEDRRIRDVDQYSDDDDDSSHRSPR